jgi:hypothetical protein
VTRGHGCNTVTQQRSRFTLSRKQDGGSTGVGVSRAQDRRPQGQRPWRSKRWGILYGMQSPEMARPPGRPSNWATVPCCPSHSGVQAHVKTMHFELPVGGWGNA